MYSNDPWVIVLCVTTTTCIWNKNLLSKEAHHINAYTLKRRRRFSTHDYYLMYVGVFSSMVHIYKRCHFTRTKTPICQDLRLASPAILRKDILSLHPFRVLMQVLNIGILAV